MARVYSIRWKRAAEFTDLVTAANAIRAAGGILSITRLTSDVPWFIRWPNAS